MEDLDLNEKWKLFILNSLALIVFLFINIGSSQAATFKDVSSKHPNSSEIEFLVQEGIIKGYDNLTFKPDNNVTNAQVATMIARTLNLDLENRPNPNFLDVSKNHGAYNAIAAVVDERIFPKGKMFYPNEPITREKMAQVLVNAFDLSGKSSIRFKDVSTKSSYYAAISTLAANNITTGYTDGTFKPKNPLTRSHFSAFLARVLVPDYIPVTGKFKFNKNYQYTYEYIENNGRIGTEVYTYKKSDKNTDIWNVTDESGSSRSYQSILTDSRFKFFAPKQGNLDEYLKFSIPSPVKLGSTWSFAFNDDYLSARYTVTSMSEIVDTEAGTFNEAMEVESSDGYLYYFDQQYGHILTYDLDNDQVVYELIELKKK